MRPFAADSNVVDLYNSATGAWTTAQLSVARWGAAGTSVGNVAIFAGGVENSAFLHWDNIVVILVLRMCACFIVMVQDILQQLVVSHATLQIVMIPMLWICTTVQLGNGQRLN
jgi:hypothetical protein